MRDIRSDLQQRAALCEDQIRAACIQYEQIAQQLERERDMRIADLQGALATIERLMLFEDALMANVVTLENRQASDNRQDNYQSQQAPLEERLRAAAG